MVGGDGGHQCRVSDLERTDAVADGDRPHTAAVGRDLSGDVRECLLRGRGRGVLEPRDRVPAVVIPYDARGADDGPRGLMRDKTFVLGELDGLVGQVGAQHHGGHWMWSLPASWSS